MRLFAGLCAALLLVAGSAALAADEKVQVGKPAPEITLEAANIKTAFPDKKDAKTLSLPKDVKGKNVVLFFYPKAMTRGCTIESCGYRDLIKDFEGLDTVVIGISTDKLEDQVKFTEKEKLNFPLLADADQKVTKEFGILGKSGFAQRTTYVIDKKGIVRKIYTGDETKDVMKHPSDVLSYVKENLKDK
jgi:peroxiredoxin Q/BCP